MKISALRSPSHQHIRALLMPLLMTIMLTLSTTGAGAIWTPDDAVAPKPSPVQGATTHQLAPPSEKQIPHKNLSKTNVEGSGGRGEAEEEEQEDYTDEERWEEEGQDQWRNKLGPDSGQFAGDPTLDSEDVQGAWESNIEVGERGGPGLDENADTGDEDIYFEGSIGDTSVRQAHVASTVPDTGLSDLVQTESDGTKLDDRSHHQLGGEVEDIAVSQSESATVSLLPTVLMSSAHPLTGRHDSNLTSVPSTRETFATSSSHESQLENDQRLPNHSNFPVINFSAAGSDTEADVDAHVDPVNSDETDDGGDLGIDADAAPPPSTSTSTTATTKATAITTAATTDAAPVTISTADAFPKNTSVTNNLADSDSKNDSNSDSDTTSDSESPDNTSSTQSPSHPPSTSSPPSCLQECKTNLDSFHLEVTPVQILTPLGSNVSLQCTLTDPTGSNLQVKLWWLRSGNGSKPCSLGRPRMEEDMERCNETIAEVEEEFSNETATVVSLTIPETAPSDSGDYACAVTAICCEGTEHEQTSATHSEASVIKIYTKPLYGVQLAAVSVVCLCLLTGILGSACFQRRRRRKKRIHGPGHVHYEPVRLLHLPQSEVGGTGDDAEDYYDDFDDGDDAVPASVEIGSVRVNPMAEVPLTPQEVMPPPPEMMSLARESQFEFPRPPSDLMKRMSSNVGFD